MKDEIELVIDFPAQIASRLQNNKIDIGLVPVAVIPSLKEHHIISDYCIACDGEVGSVCLFSDVPLAEIKTVLLDYQSKTSIELLKILLNEHWRISPELVSGNKNYEKDITGTTAGLVIGDRGLAQRSKSKYIYDLGLAWKELTGLPFVFAAWVSNKDLPREFIENFNEANELGFSNLQQVIEQNPNSSFDLESYYTKYIKFRLDSQMHAAKALFLRKINK